MIDDHIDEDLNYDVTINPKKFRNPKSAAVKSAFAEGMTRFFNSTEEMCDFMTQVSKNHPEGINLRYLVQLMIHYTTSQALTNLESKGLISSSVNEEGEIVYSLTEMGRAVTDKLI